MSVDLSQCGVIYSATGLGAYADLAARSARSVKRHNPDLQVDLYTDVDQGHDVFDRVHILSDPWARSRIDAMRMSRFERTLMLDCDTICMAPFPEVFEALDRFELAVAYDYRPNGTLSFTVWKTRVPISMPQFNGGVIAVRKSARTDAFLRDWAAAVKDHGIGRDQPSLRELLYTSDLRFLVLPEAYNLLQVSRLSVWVWSDLAPRIVHSPHFHNEFERYARADNPVLERVGLRNYWRIRQLRRSDQALTRHEGRQPERPDRWDWLRFAVWALPRLPRRVGQGVVRAVRRRLRARAGTGERP
jgi:Nucleotide-diphospho-sugar transferase